MKPKCEISSLEWTEMLKKELQQSVNAYVELCEKHKELKAEFNELKRENKQLKKQKDDVVELIKRQDKIRNYYEYEECGYDEYNYDDDFKEELLRMLGEIDEKRKNRN